jgi:hypothetical protein
MKPVVLALKPCQSKTNNSGEGLNMKLAFALLLAGFAGASHADDNTVCGMIGTCSTYEAKDSPGHVLSFKNLGGMNLLWEAKSPDGTSQTMILSFGTDGRFAIDHDRALGICDKQICRMSVRPLLNKDGEYYSQVITLKFQKDSLQDTVELDKVNIYDDGTTGSTKAIYIKQ